MIIGIPREVKTDEYRVALSPAGVKMLIDSGHQVLIERDAGIGSGFENEDYRQIGARIVADADNVWAESEMIVKVKEPQKEEYRHFREGLILFTYLHLASEPELTRALQEKHVIAIAYETIQSEDGSLPLLTPMSEVAGRMSIQVGTTFLQKPNKGRGVLLAGVPGVLPGNVVIIGGGIVGANAARMAVGLGAQVTILDINAERLRYLDHVFGSQVHTVVSNTFNIEQALQHADLVVGAVLIPGARAPRIISKEMVQQMIPGSVMVDVAIDQGGSIETMDRATTHSNPIYVKHDVIHYAVANIPGAVPRTSTLALSNVSAPYALRMANSGYRKAIMDDPALAKGVNVLEGEIVHPAVAEAFGESHVPLDQVLTW